MELRFETEQATKDCPRLKVSFYYYCFDVSDCRIAKINAFLERLVFFATTARKTTLTIKLKFNYGFSIMVQL